MSRRGTNIFGLIFKSSFESAAGRIRWRRPNMWALIGSVWDKRRVVSLGQEFVKGGNGPNHPGIVLVKKPWTHCPHPPTADLYFDGKWWHTPAVECKKCEFYRAASRSFRFPRCLWQKSGEMGDVAKETLVQVGEVVSRAAEETKRMMGE